MANERSLPNPPTRELLLDSALTRFARDGYSGTSIRDLARDAGIRESSVYKHFPSKRAILDAVVARADEALAEFGAGLGIDLSGPAGSAPSYAGITTERLGEIADAFFLHVLHRMGPLRRMLVVGQYRDPELGERYREYFIDTPLRFQAQVFEHLQESDHFGDRVPPDALALAFYSPILLLLQAAEGGPEAEAAARARLAAHVRHFSETYRRGA